MEQFKNPPIQEALLDIQVTLPADLTLEALKKFHDGLESRFPEKQERISWQQGFQISGAGDSHAISSSRSVDGYLFISKAEGKVVQVRLDGFTFNNLRPYSNWDTYVFGSLDVDTEAIWLKLAALRDLKNKVFDASLTEKVKELFR